MKEFFVGILVLILIGAFSVVGVLLFPLILLLGIALRFIVGIALLILAIWVVGKVTLLLIEAMKRNN